MWSRPAIAAGAALAVAADVALRQGAPRARMAAHAAGLVGAAVVYPALHKPTRAAEPDERRREIAGVAAAGAVVAAAVLSRRVQGRRLIAAGWAAHALFDALHQRGQSSLLPDWYPAVCAGYDVATAVAVLTPVRGRRPAQSVQ